MKVTFLTKCISIITEDAGVSDKLYYVKITANRLNVYDFFCCLY